MKTKTKMLIMALLAMLGVILYITGGFAHISPNLKILCFMGGAITNVCQIIFLAKQ